LNINEITDTSLTVFLGGGRNGKYVLRAWRDGYGYSDITDPAVVFEYKLTVSSISPALGSIAGGTTITITGTNFMPGDT
jgi:hypothetical protein